MGNWNFKVEHFLGMPAAVLDIEQTVEYVRKVLQNNKKPFFIASVNPEICVAARENKALYKAVTDCSLGIPDGVGIVLASKLTGGHISSRVTGIDLLDELCKLADSSGYSIFLLGASLNVAEMAAIKLKGKYPNLKAAGTHHGYFMDFEEGRIAQIIKDSGADIVFVGLGSPRQESFISRNAAATGACVLMTVGGSFDVISGNLKRAPEIYMKLGLEWLYRTILQPSRIIRLLKLPLFLFYVLLDKFSGIKDIDVFRR